MMLLNEVFSADFFGSFNNELILWLNYRLAWLVVV